MEDVKQLHESFAKSALGVGLDTKKVLYVGQLIPRKGIDVLLKAASGFPRDYHLYLVGGEPSNDYVDLVKALGLSNITFCSFKGKDELRVYYQAADVFTLPTREDIWGLVINEALNYGLPVVSTEKCLAAVEMLTREAIVLVENDKLLCDRIIEAAEGTFNDWDEYSISKILLYSIEGSSRTHVEIFNKLYDNI